MTVSAEGELLRPNETILNDQYIIERHLGSGSQGQVYLARHRIFDQVAIKRLHRHIATQEYGLVRFERELWITHQLRGDHVIFIHNFDQDTARNEWFSVMEYADGGSLRDKLAIEAPLSIAEAIGLAIILCQGLAYVHQYPYVHGDLKPHNILFQRKPNHAEPVLKLGDFGSAFQPPRTNALPLPSSLNAARTLLYVSPELLISSELEVEDPPPVEVDQRVDIYAIGVILYEMLTGRPPFWQPIGESDPIEVNQTRWGELHQQIKQQIPPEPKKQRSEILPSLNDLVMKALAKYPDARFASVREMQEYLEEVLREEKMRSTELESLRPLANQSLTEQQWGQASDLLYKILEWDPDDSDASQKLKIAQQQQTLMNLRHQISQRINDKLWDEARDLLEKALRIAPDDPTLTTSKEKIYDQLTIIDMLKQAKEAEKKAKWLEVIRLCHSVLAHDPQHNEAPNLLSHAETQHKIVSLRQEARALRKRGDKQGELEKLTELLKVTPDNKVINTRIEILQKMTDVETYFAQGKQAFDERKWRDAVEILQKVLDIDPFYRRGKYSATNLKMEAAKMLEQEKAKTLLKLHQENIQHQWRQCEGLIDQGKWLEARKLLREIHRVKNYHFIISKNELLVRLFYIKGQQYIADNALYKAQICFNRVIQLNGGTSYRDTSRLLTSTRDLNSLSRNYTNQRTLGVGATTQVDCVKDIHRGGIYISLKYLRASFLEKHDDTLGKYLWKAAKRAEILDHENIVKILAVECRSALEHIVDREGMDMPVVVMEYVDGQNLADYLRGKNGLRPVEAIKLTCQICRGLEHAHSKQIFHLDVKPSNILIQTDRRTVKLTDFTHAPYGTPGYRAPEQVVREKSNLDARTDIFAVGRVLYTLLTGNFSFEDPFFTNDPNFGQIPSSLQDVIRKAAAPDPKDRFQSAQEMLEALRRVESELPLWLKIRQRVIDVWPKVGPFVRTWQGALAIIGPILVVIIIPLLIQASSADPNTSLGRAWQTVIAYFSGSEIPVLAPRLMHNVEFVVNGNPVKDLTKPYFVVGTRQIHIELEAHDLDGKIINADQLLCEWTLPLPQDQTTKTGGQCKITYEVVDGIDNELVKVVIKGSDASEVKGVLTRRIHIILPSDKGASNEQ